MDLRSCNNCGVVLDADKLPLLTQNVRAREDGSYDEDYAAWNGERWVAKIACPVCYEDILNSES